MQCVAVLRSIRILEILLTYASLHCFALLFSFVLTFFFPCAGLKVAETRAHDAELASQQLRMRLEEEQTARVEAVRGAQEEIRRLHMQFGRRDILQAGRVRTVEELSRRLQGRSEERDAYVKKLTFELERAEATVKAQQDELKDYRGEAAELREQSGGAIKPKLVGYTDAPTDPRGLDLEHPELQHWDGGYLDGIENLTADSQLGSADWLAAQGFPADVVEAAAAVEAEGRVSWNGWRGDMGWLGPAAPGFEAGKPTATGCAPPAVYSAEQSDTFVMCDLAIDYIDSQAAAAEPWAMHLSLLKPHTPLIAPAPYNEMYPLADVSLPEHRAASAEAEGEAHPFLATAVREMTEEQLRESRSSYYGLIT